VKIRSELNECIVFNRQTDRRTDRDDTPHLA
jgi:hypothetical protein